jgi:serine/threonine-protein kinase
VDAKAREKALVRARSLEKAGKSDDALKLFREAGAVDDAARVLGALRRPRDAAQVLLESLGVQPGQVGQLDSQGRKRALMAAILLAKAGENELAVELFMALGEQGRAVELLQRAGDHVGAARLSAAKPGQFDTGPLLSRAAVPGGQAVSVLAAQKLEKEGKLQLALEAYVQLKRFGEAARMAKALRQPGEAAQLYADAGMPFEAAHCYLEHGDTGKALDSLTRVQRDDARYRTAAAQAVRLATNLNALDFRLENFLGAFVKSGPQGEDEPQVFDLLARLYATHGFPENAREALQKILAAQPANEDARRRLAELEAEHRPSAMVARQVLAQADLHKRRTFDDLPGLDDPPDAEQATMLQHDPELVRKMTGPGASAQQPLPEAEVIDEPQPGTPADHFQVGSTAAGRYRLEAQIGKGGMATVFRAYDLELEEKVALKVFNVQHSTDVLVARFKQELKLSRQLIHPNITRLYDIGIHQGHRYLSMELLTGKSLKDVLARPIELRTALGYLVQACHGLQAAHEAGVVHRDVKPDNFFITNDGVLKVMDFGIAKQHATPGVTVAGSIAGTPSYMSPEQISNFSNVSHLTDLYALGICAYEMFTGRVPFSHTELVPLLMLHVNAQPEPPRKLNPSLPAELEAAVLKLLAKDPAQRYQSCRELSLALSAIRDRLPA